MSAIACAVVGSAVIGAGSAMYIASQQPDAQTSMPASYYTYDADGNLTGSQVWDTSRNAYVYTTNLTDEQKAEKKRIAALKDQFLGYLNETPSDRLKAYDEYTEAYSTAMHKDADKQYDKLKTATEESLAGKGMFGSKAYADMMSELGEQKIGMDKDIANASVLARENLATQDKNYWLSALNTLDNAENADNALALQKAQNAANIATQSTASLNAGDALLNSSRYANWQTKANTINSIANNLSDTSTGLAFLYGYKNKDK